MLSVLALAILSLGQDTSQTPVNRPGLPVFVPTKFVSGQWLVQATVGSNQNWFVLSTSAKTSLIVPNGGKSGPIGSTDTESVQIGSTTVPDVKFQTSTTPILKQLSASGILGRDVLSHLNIAVDIDQMKIGVWQDEPTVFGEIGWVLLAPGLSNDTQHVARLSVWDVDAVPYGVKGSVGSTPGTIIPSLGDSAGVLSSVLDSRDSLPTIEDARIDAVDGISIGEVGPFWTVARAVNADDLPYAKNGEIATLPIQNLPTRRVVFDGPTGLVLAEVLGPLATNTVCLSRLVGLPFEIIDGVMWGRRGGGLYANVPPSFEGANIISIGGFSGERILRALDASPITRMAIVDRLSGLKSRGLTIRYMTSDGKILETTLK